MAGSPTPLRTLRQVSYKVQHRPLNKLLKLVAFVFTAALLGNLIFRTTSLGQLASELKTRILNGMFDTPSSSAAWTKGNRSDASLMPLCEVFLVSLLRKEKSAIK